MEAYGHRGRGPNAEVLAGRTLDGYLQLLRSIPQALRWFYHQARPNRPIPLYRGTLFFTGQSGRKEVQGGAELAWLPSPRLAPVVESDPQLFFEFVNQQPEIGLPDLALVPRPPRGPIDGLGGIWLSQEVGTGSRFRRIDFTLCNFPDVHGAPIRDRRAMWRGRVTLDSSRWRITLDSRRDLSERNRERGETGGYLLTHIGRLERPDGSVFSKSDAATCLEGLHSYFSFTAGHQTGPILPVGFDEQNTATWGAWSVPTISQRVANDSWFSRIHPEQMQQLFPLFEDALYSRKRETLRLATTYYADGNQQTNIQRSILLGQIALEALAFAVLVNDRQSLSATAFERQKTARSIRQLLTALRLPTVVPSSLRGLKSLANAQAWSDAPEALSQLRNELVHLRPDEPPRPPRAWIDAWRLSMWYCELVGLAWLGYGGEYVNRLRGPRPLGAPLEPLPRRS